MSHFGDFMDDVPVKISEKYKKVPRIELPNSASECTVRAQNVVEIVRYSSTFETNILSKLKELRSAKETKKNERKYRLHLLEEAKQKKLDAIAAAEEQDRLKQLSVSDVSYPSTEEISALSPDDKADKNCDTTKQIDNSLEASEPLTQDTSYPTRSIATESQLNILQPTPVLSHYQGTSLLDDPNPFENLKISTKINKIPYNHNVDTLTFKDFEQDTSSPFDNVELKTINDMELLAQVLQSERSSNTSCPPQQMYIPDQSYVVPNCASQAQLEGVQFLPNTYTEQSIQGPGLMYAQQPYSVPNGYYVPAESENVNMYIPNFQYYVPSNPYSVEPTYYNQIPSTSADVTQMQNGSTYVPQPYYYYPQQPVPYASPQYAPPENTDNQEMPLPNVVKSRSRSVPDIVKELNDELASEKLRANERSYNPSPTPKSIAQPQTSKAAVKEVKRSRKRAEQLPNPFEKLSPKLQSMCQNIHGMGFPLDRVARVCTLVGDNDKKVIEGLLMMGELMDLGLSEGRVSAALAKHEFNKDKALDELVS